VGDKWKRALAGRFSARSAGCQPVFLKRIKCKARQIFLRSGRAHSAAVINGDHHPPTHSTEYDVITSSLQLGFLFYSQKHQ
jgi:hypothetical protein